MCAHVHMVRCAAWSHVPGAARHCGGTLVLVCTPRTVALSLVSSSPLQLCVTTVRDGHLQLIR